MSQVARVSSSALRRRVPTAMVYGAVVLAAIVIGPPWFHLAVLLGALLAYRELWRLFARTAYAPSLAGGFALVIVFVILHVSSASARAAQLSPVSVTRTLDQLCADASAPLAARLVCALADVRLDGVIAAALLVAGAAALRRSETARGLVSAAATLVGALYCGWLLGYLIDIADVGAAAAGPHAEGILQRSWIFLAIFPTWASDLAAYGVGSLLGRRKLLARVSPGKTVEGTLGGLAAAAIIAVLIAGLVEFPLWVGLAAGVIVGIAAPFGDLVESAIKRAAAAKDSGDLLPGHGGVLDRLDSLIFVAPALSLFFELALRFS